MQRQTTGFQVAYELGISWFIISICMVDKFGDFKDPRLENTMTNRYTFIEMTFITTMGTDSFISGVLDTSTEVIYNDSVMYSGYATSRPLGIDSKPTDWRFL